MNEKDNPSDRRGAKRAAYSHVQHLSSSMNRGERLAVSMKLIEVALDEVDKGTSVQVDMTVKGQQTFNGKIEDIQVLAPNLPAKTLVELAVDILTAELRN